MRPPEGALVAFATEPGRLAADGKDAGNGLYTRHLARWIKEPNLTLEQVFKRTREAVQLESKGEQIPTEYSVLTGADLYLAGNAPKGLAMPPVAAASAGVKNAPPPGSIAMASRSADPAMPAPSLSEAPSARVKLARLGAGFTKQSYQLALDNDDLPVFELLVAAGWQVQAWDIVRLMDLRENLSWMWPEKIMNSIAQNAKAWPIQAQLCDQNDMQNRFNNLPDLLRRGYDSPALDGSRVLFERENFNRLIAPRRAFYNQLCGASALAQQPSGR